MYTTIAVSFIDPANGKKLRHVHLCVQHFEVCRDNYLPEERRITNAPDVLQPCSWCTDAGHRPPLGA